jgi:2-iminobutanoate/2-iminopropanoate deaminase
MKRVVSTKSESINEKPYSPAISYKNLLFVSGQVSFDQERGEVIHGDIKTQVRLALENLKTILEAGGSSIENVLKVTVFLTDMTDYDGMNKVYMEYFKDPRPARTCIQAAGLPFGVKVEIDAIAHCK